MTLTCGGVNGADYTQQYIRLDIRTNTKIPTLNACKNTSDNATNSGSSRGPISGGSTSTVVNNGSKLWHYFVAMNSSMAGMEEQTQLLRIVAATHGLISGNNGGGSGGGRLWPINGGN